jgi:oligopeptide transport system permease protein
MNYLIWRLIKIVLSLFLVVTITFAGMKFIPGDPFSDEKELPPETLHALRAHYGLEDPWYIQYGNYLLSLAKGDLGPSFRQTGRSVNEIIADSFPVSAILGFEALCIAFSLGILLGSVSALYFNRWQDHLLTTFMILGISLPSFLLAGFLQYTLAIKLGWFPVARWGTWMQAVLPVLALSIMPMSFIARQVRSNMIGVLKQNYIRTAFSKGLNVPNIIVKHALKNALAPLFAYFGQLTANILAGSFIIEKIFGIPGLGQWFVISISNRDYTVITGITLFYSTLLLTLLFIADVVYALCDPRVKQATIRTA